jgi:prepilin-type N-terminal cleavage/methylation domain-containing protein
MLPSVSHHRRGMSLIELLVVVSIIGLLAATVIPSLASSSESRRTREAARTISSFISRAQSRAIGRREWSGFSIFPASASSSAGVDIAFAETPPVYRGPTAGSMVDVVVSGLGGTLNYYPESTAKILAQAGVIAGDLICFNGTGSWYELTAGGAGIKRRPFKDSGQTDRNTPWPAAGVSHTYEIALQPRTTGSPVPVPNARVIDLSCSGYVVSGVGWVPFAGPGDKVTILFDGAGQLRSINDGSSVTVTGPVMLLVGRADRAGQPRVLPLDPKNDSLGANWQYPDSAWIGINPMTGAVRTAGCVPNAATVDDSQAWIRQSLLDSGG